MEQRNALLSDIELSETERDSALEMLSLDAGPRAGSNRAWFPITAAVYNIIRTTAGRHPRLTGDTRSTSSRATRTPQGP